MFQIFGSRSGGLVSALGLVVALVGFSGSALASPTPGDLDPSFGHHGTVLTKIAHEANAVAITGRGKIVVAGGDPFAVARYKANGKLDDSFSKNGKARIGKDSGFLSAQAVAIGDHGKVVAAGLGLGGQGEAFAIARYKRNGRLDRSFSSNGMVRVGAGRGNASALSVAIDHRGRIVVGGFVTNNPYSRMIRLTPDGRLDPAFDHNGILQERGAFSFTSLAIDSSGLIIAGDNGGSVELLRVTPNGDVHHSFGAANAGQRRVYVALDDRGRIVAAGDDEVVRMKPNGQPDPSFGTNGKVTSKHFGNAYGVAVDSRERVVDFGSRYHNGIRPRLRLARFLENGAPDSRFGRDGKVATNFPGETFAAGGVAVDRKDRIVAVGGAGPHGRFIVARYIG